MKFVNNVWLEQSKIYCCRFLFTWLIYLLFSFLSFLIFFIMSNWVTHVRSLRQGQPREQQHQCTYVPQLSLTICPAPPLPSLPPLSLFQPSFALFPQIYAELSANSCAHVRAGLALSLSLSFFANDPGRDSERGSESIFSFVPCPPLPSPGSTGIRIINTRDESRLMCI